MKKIIFSFSILLITLITLTGCSAYTKISYTYNVETGDKIKISLKSTDGSTLSSALPFKVSKNNQVLSQGTFIKGSYYDQYVNVAKSGSETEILDEGSKDNIEYVFYSYKDKEYNYVIKVKDSSTAILLGNANSKEEAQNCFDMLTFELVK